MTTTPPATGTTIPDAPRRFRPRRFCLCLLLMLSVLPATTGEALAARTPERLVLLLDWFVNPDHAPLIVAQEKGFFAARGLEVELLAPADPNDPPKLVAAGSADIAITYQPQLHLQVAAGLPVIRVGTLVDAPLASLVVLADGPVRTIPDLAGKKIGYSVGAMDRILLRPMLDKYGIGMDQVELVNVNFNLTPALLSGQVDAILGAFRNFELADLDIRGVGGRAFYVEEEGVPPYDELIFIVRKDRAREPAIDAFLDAVAEGVHFLLNHPEEGYELFVRGAREERSSELFRRAYAATLPRFSASPAATDPGRYRAFAQFLWQAGLIPGVRPVGDYVRLP